MGDRLPEEAGKNRRQFDGTPGSPNPEPGWGWLEYRKTSTIQAVQVDERFAVNTREGIMFGEPGDWLAEGPAGERYPIGKDIFEATYAPACNSRTVRGPRSRREMVVTRDSG